jgi:hypothetical protein
MLERINPSYPSVLVKFSTDTTQESEAATHIENPQLVISSERNRSKGIGKHSFHYCTYLLGSHRRRMVVGPEVGFLSFLSPPRRYESIQLLHTNDGHFKRIYLKLQRTVFSLPAQSSSQQPRPQLTLSPIDTWNSTTAITHPRRV